MLGSHPSQMEKISIITSARKKEGVETANSENTMMILSAALLCHTAEIIPNRMPTTEANRVPPTASFRVAG